MSERRSRCARHPISYLLCFVVRIVEIRPGCGEAVKTIITILTQHLQGRISVASIRVKMAARVLPGKGLFGHDVDDFVELCDTSIRLRPAKQIKCIDLFLWFIITYEHAKGYVQGFRVGMGQHPASRIRERRKVQSL